jgi:hypothetical protein
VIELNGIYDHNVDTFFRSGKALCEETVHQLRQKKPDNSKTLELKQTA